MNTFESIHQEAIEGNLSMFDRILFKGHLMKLHYPGNVTWFLYRQGVKLVDFKAYVTASSERIKAHAQAIAKQAGRRFAYLNGLISHHSTGQSKEEYARQIAAEEGIREGLVAVFSTVEGCRTVGVRKNAEGLVETFAKPGQCLHYYFYYLDAEFGLMHIRLQSWLPYTIQIYINGREWLGKQLDQRGIGYRRYENSFTHIDDLKTAQELCEQFAHREWAPVLKAFAKRVNPLLEVIQQVNFGEYYWVIDQCEYATDVMFRDRARLEQIMPDLYQHALLQGSPQDVMRFLGRKPHGRFEGEVVTDLKKRPQGWRIKYCIQRNTLKMYDKASILRVETTINNPRDFKVSEETADQTRRWKTMGKGVSNLWRYREVSQQANERLLEGLAQAKLKSEAVPHLDDLCRSRTKDGKRFARFNPLSQEDLRLFQAISAGEFALNGFRNHDVCSRLFPLPAASPTETARRRAKVSRLIAKLRGHGLIAKVKDSRLYRLSKHGAKVLFAILSFHHLDFPLAFLASS